MPKHIKYTREILESFVKQSVSVAQVLRLLNRPLCGGTHTYISKTIKKLGIDTSHFTGQASNRGKHSATRKTADEILVKGNNYREDAFRLRRAMLEKGVKMECVKCHIGPEYNKEPLILEIDHINNDWTDNTLRNLQFMCPNCHAQKSTSDGSKAKFLKQIKTILLPYQPNKPPLLKKGERRVIDKGGQLSLGLYSKGPRKSSKDIDWRKLPKENKRKVVRPSKETLEQLIWQKPVSVLSDEYKVSNTAIHKWCKSYAIKSPPRGYWAKRAAGQTHEEAIK